MHLLSIMNTRVCIPEYSGRVSPLFDTARDCMIYTMDGGTVMGAKRIALPERGVGSRLDFLSTNGVTSVICSAISRIYSDALIRRGIVLIPGVIGPVEEVISAFGEGKLTVDEYQMPGCRWKGRFRKGLCPDYQAIVPDTFMKGVTGKMKIAITSEGAGAESPVDPRFGRAAGFIIHDTDSGEFQWQDNASGRESQQGAGIVAAKNIVNSGARVLITGHVGPKAFSTLQAAGIEIYSGAGGTVREAVERFNAGELARASGADVDGHW